MTQPEFRLLPEGLAVDAVVDDHEFTEVTNDGEVYTLYRIVRFTHEAIDHVGPWTHQANVARVRIPAMGTAMLRIVDRSVEASRVSLSPGQL